MKRISLNGQWDVKAISPDGNELFFDGTVPGSSLNDVISAGIEKNNNIFWRDTADSFQQYEDYDWVYTKKFLVPENVNDAHLYFERLDTYCDVYLNGIHLGYTENGNIAHLFYVEELKAGENEIEVKFYSPKKVIGTKEKRWCAFGSVDRLYTRRTQCTYGWDWTMRFVSCGIGGDTYIEEIPKGLKIEDVYVYTKDIDSCSAAVGIDVYTSDFDDGEILYMDIYDSNGILIRHIEKYCSEEFLKLDIDIPEPMLWFPRGYGEQNLYKLTIKASDRELYTTDFGIRKVRIIELPDREGSENYIKCLNLKENTFLKIHEQNNEFSGFKVVVNNKEIMCKGANWVPCQPFASGTTDEKVTKILELSAEAGVNMIRVWGGGNFETTHFYDECSRLGIMVTQDFLMACGDYPAEEDFLKQLEQEICYIAKLIRNKPCLAWWTGDNENATEGSDTAKEFCGRTIIYKCIAPIWKCQ